MKQTITLALLLTAATAFSQPRPLPIENQLNLTDEQKTAWKAAVRDFRTANEALFDKQRNAQEQVHDALEAKSPDPCAVGTAMVSLHAVEEQLRTAHEALDQKLETLLTPEQKAKFESRPPRPPMPPPPPRF